MGHTWKKLSQKTLLSHERLSVYEDEVELPSGHRTQYIHFGKTPDAACVIAVNEKNQILVQKEYSYPPNEWLYQFPGGALNKGESPEAGALREFAEEASLTGKLRNLGWYYMDNRRRASKFYVFLATDLSSKLAIKDDEEEFETYWFSALEIEKMIAQVKIINYSILAAWAIFKSHNDILV